MTHRQEKLTSLYTDLISTFILRLRLQKNLVTVTGVELSKDSKYAKIFISIYPEGKEKEALKILQGNRQKVREFIGSKTSMKFLPRFDFEIDKGEKNRQKIEELLAR